METRGTIAGTLGEMPLISLLTRLAEEARSGTLSLVSASGDHTIDVARGQLTGVTTHFPGLDLGATLVALGKLEASSAHEIVDSAATDTMNAAALLTSGLVSEQDVKQARDEQQIASVLRLIERLRPSTRYRFTDGEAAATDMAIPLSEVLERAPAASIPAVEEKAPAPPRPTVPFAQRLWQRRYALLLLTFVPLWISVTAEESDIPNRIRSTALHRLLLPGGDGP
jgi:hypothetical protein